EINAVAAYFGAIFRNNGDVLQRGAVRANPVDLRQQSRRGDGGHRFGIVEPIANLRFAKLRATRNEDSTQLDDRQGGDVKLRKVGQPQKNAVAGLYAELAERAGTAGTGRIKLAIGEGLAESGSVFPLEGRLVAVAFFHLAPCEGRAEVELRWNGIPRLPV